MTINRGFSAFGEELTPSINTPGGSINTPGESINDGAAAIPVGWGMPVLRTAPDVDAFMAESYDQATDAAVIPGGQSPYELTIPPMSLDSMKAGHSALDDFDESKIERSETGQFASKGGAAKPKWGGGSDPSQGAGSLLEGMQAHLSKTNMVPSKWIKANVKTSESIPELQSLLKEKKSPDYVRMAVGERLKQLGIEHPFG